MGELVLDCKQSKDRVVQGFKARKEENINKIILITKWTLIQVASIFMLLLNKTKRIEKGHEQEN